MKKLLALLLILVMAFAVIGCESNSGNEVEENVENNQVNNEVENTEEKTETNDEPEGSNAENSQEENSSVESETETASSEDDREFDPNDLSTYNQEPVMVTELTTENRPLVTIEMTDGQIMKLLLIPEVAPNTVNAFITLIEDGFYDGLIFHRIIKDFMIQGGDPLGMGTGGPGYTIKAEFYNADIEAQTLQFIPHFRGVLSMARSQAPDSAGSQFFICHQDAHHLNGQYTAFGYVYEGLDVVDNLANVETGASDKPVEDVVIKSITVDLNGYEKSEPELIQ